MDALPLVFPAGTGGGPFGRRLRRPAAGRSPVVLVTGFLGAGKTTLLRALLESPEGRGTAVVVNEFGEVGLDQALLAPGAEGKVALLGNGCLCCLRRSDLEATLRTLHADRLRGAIPAFARVVLETSGADDPTPVLQSLLDDRALAREYHLQSVIAVLDATAGAAALAATPEARRQLAVADRIVVGKADLASAEAVQALLDALRGLAPGIAVEVARHGRVPPDFLLAEGALPRPSRLTATGAEAIHLPGLASFTLGFDKPLPWRRIAAALALLQNLRGADLLRVKGLLAIEGCGGPVVVQAVGHVLHRPLELEGWPDGDVASRLVFITRGTLARDRVKALLDAVLAI
ncbi:MAG: GTP-binding protein [Roseomonas sp.]|nr:GTP-binding protein [Roseomonas sp.]